MAKIEMIHPKTEHFPAYTETVEARVWATGGTNTQPFYIGSGLNFHANGTLWLEIIYCVQGAQVFYTRNFFQHEDWSDSERPSLSSRFEEIVAKGEGQFGFGDILPETRLDLSFHQDTYRDEDGGEERHSTDCTLEIYVDVGVVFGRGGPGGNSINLVFNSFDMEDGIRFMRQLIAEVESAQQGKHPDPKSFPDGSSEWPFLWQLNQSAYNRISEDYLEEYFEDPLLADTFNRWMERLPRGGKVLDAGCGHGQPVINCLLERGFQVTGSDLSPEMLRRAREQFPYVNFIHQATTMITDQAEFDGICSFNSLLYLDPIDLLNSIRRLNQALKPDGLLFLYAYDSGPDWRGEPFGYRVGEWMWSWHYGMEEASNLLQEHGYFRVLEAAKVLVDPEDEARIARELEKDKQEEEEYYRRQAENPSDIKLPYPHALIERKPYSYLLVAHRCDCSD